MNETQTRTLSDIAREASECFEHVERGDETITTTRDGSPEWVREMVYAAHGDMLPDDWRYEAIEAACDAIADAGVEDEHDLDRADIEFEFADGHVSIWNHDRTAWLASNLTRAGYVDEARDEGLIGEDADTFQRIGVGMYAEAREVFGEVRRALVERLEEVEDEDADEDAPTSCEKCGAPPHGDARCAD